MGLDTIQDWTAFDAAIQELRNRPGVFASEGEKLQVITAVKAAIAHEADTTKKMQMASDVANIANSVVAAGILPALKSYFPWLSTVI